MALKTITELHIKLLRKGHINTTRQALTKHAKRGVIQPEALNTLGHALYNYKVCLQELKKAGLAT